VFKHTTAGNNLKPFRVRTAYADAGGDGGFFLGRVRGRHLFEGGSYVMGRDGLSMA
jgi:hypothetical protein